MRLEKGKNHPDRMRFLRDMTALGRLGQAEEVASIAVFLASGDASYVTGQNIMVNGGWTIGPSQSRRPPSVVETDE